MAEGRLVSVADTDIDRCDLAPAAARFEGSGQLVAAGGVDALIVATPVGAHLADARAAAAAGLPSLVEKPPAQDAAGARVLAWLQPSPRIAFNRRFDPRLRLVRDRLRSAGATHLTLTFHYRKAAWKAFVADDDVLLDVGPHLLDLSRWIIGSEIRRVRTARLGPKHCELELDLVRGGARLSCRSNRPYFEGIVVRDGAGSTVARWSRRGLGRRWSNDDFVESIAAQLRAFCAAVRGAESAALATSADGVAVMEAIDAARRSATEDGGWVDLP